MKSIDGKNEDMDYGPKTDEVERQFRIICLRPEWAMLAALEPALLNLLRTALNADIRHSGDFFCGQWFWHGELKPRMLQVVGHGRPGFHLILGTDDAMNLAYDTLCYAVPPCRNCPHCGGDYENGE